MISWMKKRRSAARLLFLKIVFIFSFFLFTPAWAGSLDPTLSCCLYFSGTPSDECTVYGYDTDDGTIYEVQSPEVYKKKVECKILKDSQGLQYFSVIGTNDKYYSAGNEIIVPSNLVGSPGPIQASTTKCVDMIGYVEVQSTNKDLACVVGEYLTQKNATFKSSLSQALINNFKSGLEPQRQNLCCIPVEKDGGSCAAPQWNNLAVQAYVTGEYDQLAQYYFTSKEWKDFQLQSLKVENIFTCEPSNSNWTQKWEILGAACTDVIGAAPIPPKVAPNWEKYKNENPDAGLNLKFTTSFWCSVYDPAFTQWCICAKDESVCGGDPFAEKSACESQLTKSGSPFFGGNCKEFGLLAKESGVQTCDGFAKKQDTALFPPDIASSLNPLGPITIQQYLGRIIKLALGVIGSIAFVMFIYGGVMWMAAGGNSEREGKAFKTLFWAGMGVVVILASYALVDFVFEAFR